MEDNKPSEGRSRGEEEEGEEGEKEVPWRVYCAHGLSTWGDNMWWFAGGCYMLELQPESLRLTATYGLVIAASVILLGASVGRWIDRSGRIAAARVFLAVQNTAVSLCALLLAGFIHYRPQLEAEPGHLTTLVSAAAILLASVARLASCGTNIIIQKDWVVVIAAGDSDRLATMNSILRTIELTTYAVAPAVAGWLFTLLGFGVTGVLLAGWNLCSVALEYLLLALIYRRYPALAHKRVGSRKGEESEEGEEERRGLESEDGRGRERDDDKGREREEEGAVLGALRGWSIYLHHPVLKAGLGLACLYMTVLGFDNITYGYCLMQGVPHAALGLLVGVSALVGVAGSLAYPAIRRRVGLERTGLLGMFLLVSCTSLALLSVLLPGSPLHLPGVWPGPEEPLAHPPWTLAGLATNAFWSDYCSVLVFLAGIILARFGLWIVDLTVNQLLQEKVEEDVRGVVNGVQDSLNNTLDLTKCVLVILLPGQETFGLLVLASFLSVCLGWLLYALYSRSQRGHLFHFRRLAQSLVCLPDPGGKPEAGAEGEREGMVGNNIEQRLDAVS